MRASSRPTRLLLALIASRVRSATTCGEPQTIQLSLGPCVILSNPSDIISWGIRIGVDNSGEVCAVPSTVVNSTFLASSEICNKDQLDFQGLHLTESQCRSKRGGYTFKDRLPPTPIAGLAELNPGWGALDNTITESVNATLRLGRHDISTVAPLFSDGNVSVTSHLGLAAGSTLLQDLKDRLLIGSRSWGLNSGSHSERFPRPGSLILGGYDEASLAGSFQYFDVKVPDKLETRNCPLQVLITGLSMVIHSPNTTQPVVKELVSNANKLPACIEPYDNQFRMPGPILGQIQSLFREVTRFPGSPVAPSEYMDRLYNIEPGIVYPTSAGPFNATLRFTLNSQLMVDVPFYEIQRPLRGLDAKGRLVRDANYTELQIYGMPAEADAPVLGKTFLSQLYLYVNYETMKFGLAPQSTAHTTSILVATDGEVCRATPPGASSERKALMGVSVVLGVLMISLGGLWAYKRRRKPGSPQQGVDLPRMQAELSEVPPYVSLPRDKPKDIPAIVKQDVDYQP
ncbi:hypothetical protein OQA88_2278 [Cercophora sp. LCS_1]